jgi:hypothetical protein
MCFVSRPSIYKRLYLVPHFHRPVFMYHVTLKLVAIIMGMEFAFSIYRI